MGKIKTYSIGDTAEMTNVTAKQIRHWEGRHIRVPARSVCGQRAYRRYTEQDVSVIRKIKEYVDMGFTLKAASAKAHEDIKIKEGEYENSK